MTPPAIIAHRGANREAPENTLAAFARAIALGADGIELDVHRTADGAVVVHHDPIPKSASGQSALAWRPLAAMTLAEVRQVRLRDGHSIPTLNEVLELVADKLIVYCELKGAGVEEIAAPLLRDYRGRSAMHSFNHLAVLRAADLAPNVPRGILIVSRLVDTTAAMRAAKATAVWPQTEFIDTGLVDEVHGIGGSVISWTANDPLEVRRLTALGVDGLCSDDVPGTRAASTFRPSDA